MNKTIKWFCLVVSLVFSLFFFSQCKKDTHTPLSITLYNKSLDTIQLYTKGKWKLNYANGGILGLNYIQNIDNTFWTIDNNHILITEDNTITTDTTIKWIREAIGSDSTYTLNCNRRGSQLPLAYIPYEINNDELILKETGFDPILLHFTK